MKKFWYGIASGIAVALGLTLFIMWKLKNHKGNMFEASMHIANPNINTDKVLEEVGKKDAAYEEQLQTVTTNIEKMKKEEVINAFKKAFGVPVTDLNGTGSNGV